MALKPTIYRFRLTLSDTNRNRYDTLNLTVAQHPSETVERMMVRLLAFCINADEHLAFSKGGLSSPDEPDLVAYSLDDRLLLWIDVGEPAAERIRKAVRTSERVRVYSFNSKSDVWWKQAQGEFALMPVEVFQFQWDEVRALAGLVERRALDLAVTLTEETAYVSTDSGDCALSWRTLQAGAA